MQLQFVEPASDPQWEIATGAGADFDDGHNWGSGGEHGWEAPLTEVSATSATCCECRDDTLPSQ